MAGFVSTWAALDSLCTADAGTIGCIVTAWPFPFRASWQLSIDRLIGRITMSYTAPVKDMLFVLSELSGIADIAKL
ncbi:acyl-CoA dehydrogenase N-terminal domain-containing protein, partial [Paraburkholderia franconis]